MWSISYFRVSHDHAFRLPKWLVLLTFLFCTSTHPLCAQRDTEEYRIKAAFIFHFAQLIEWPDAGLPDPQVLWFCTQGDDPFQGELDRMVTGKQIGSRTIRVRHLKRGADVRSCQLLFIADGNAKETAALLQQLGNAPLVTVGDSDNFVQRGGMIGFCMDDNKVRFEINLHAAERAQVAISSRLLALAKTIVGKTGS